jgi:outer membrane lipoprotein-sorting protein
MTLTRRSLTLALAAAPFATPAAAQALAPADKATVDRAVAYLEGLSEAMARFVQTDARGRTTSGDVFLKRPGKARFAYDAPSGLLVVSDGHKVAVQDTRLKSFDSYPLMATPLSFLLAKTIRLDKGVRVSRVARLADGFAITARDAKNETGGQITVSFSDNPLTLVGWSILDPQGRTTRVQLQGLQRTSGLASSLFVLNDPRQKNLGRGKV